MKKYFLAALLFCLILQQASSQRAFDVLHYRFEITLSDNSDMISCRALITVKVLANSPSLSFDLTTIHPDNKKGMSVVDIKEDSAKLAYHHSDDKLNIIFTGGLKEGQERNILISYTGIPIDGLIISKNKYGRRCFFADNWPNRGHNWLPCVDEPGDKASVEFLVTAPLHYQVVANGILVEETNLSDNKKLTYWREDVPIATKVMVIGAADFAVNLSGVVDGCIPVYSWVYPEDRDKGFYDYALATEILPFFIKNVGPYGYKKLANVQSKTTFGGLENANTIFYSENSVTGTRRSEDLLAHEIAHQWFGNMATEKSFAHLWLSEGFATYMTILYMENKYGKDTAVKMLQTDRRQVANFAKKSQQPVVDESKDYMALLNANSYQKGGWVLHMLRRDLGDAVFNKSIQAYYAAYAGKNADTRDLQHIFEKVSGKDLGSFFDQWLYRPGIPQLDVQWKYTAGKKELKLTVKQLQEKPFQFPLEISAGTGATREKTYKVLVKQAVQVFTFPIAEKVNRIALDPNTLLLFEGTATETK